MINDQPVAETKNDESICMVGYPSQSNRQMDLTTEHKYNPQPYDDINNNIDMIPLLPVSPISTQVFVCSTY